MWIKRAAAFTLFVAFPFVMTGAGCSENAAATSKCNTQKSADTCETCCKSNGANGYKYMGSCACLGG